MPSKVSVKVSVLVNVRPEIRKYLKIMAAEQAIPVNALVTRLVEERWAETREKPLAEFTE